MISEALVIDNSDFFKKGTIRVRVKKRVYSDVAFADMAIDPKRSIEDYGQESIEINGDERKFSYAGGDYDAYVSTGVMGMAFDAGVFMLPQPNTWGIVAKIGTSMDEDKFVWLGGITKFNELSKTIDGPSDKLPQENADEDEENNTGEVVGDKNLVNEEETPNLTDPFSSFVFKQRETHIVRDDELNVTDDNKSTLNWEERPLNNMIVMNRDKVYMYHNLYKTEDDGTKTPNGRTLVMFDNNGVSIKFKNTEIPAESEISALSDGTFRISAANLNKGTMNSVSGGLDFVEISHQGEGETSAQLHMGSSQVQMGNNNSSDVTCNLTISKGKQQEQISMSTNNGINISSDSNISINPGSKGEVTIGTGTGYILTTNKLPGTTVNVDGQAFQVSHCKA